MRKLVIMTLLISSFFIQNCLSQRPAFKGYPLERQKSLAGTGFKQTKLDSLTEHLENNLATTGMMVLKNGKVVYEYGDLTDVGYLASCRKSILSILYGKYVTDGTIDLNESIGEIGIDEDQGLLEIEKSATVDHIINARSGVFYNAANRGYDENNIQERGSVKPGEYFVYNNWDFNVAGYIFEKKCGNTIYEEIEKQLAIPLGFQDWNIKNQKKHFRKKKSRFPAYHMYISTRDMAKIGQLMLNKGKWNGKQIISEEWINKITKPVSSLEEVNERYGRTESSPFQLSYGNMWWFLESFRGHPDFEGAYQASGWGGQFLTIIPRLDVVVVHKCALSKLVRWGMKDGGVKSPEYWELLYNLINDRI